MLSALDERAEALGLQPGTGVADARGMHPGLEILEDEPEARRGLLESLADWSDRYTPLVGLEGEAGLFLDISGCAHLFGGESLMGEDALARLSRQGFSVRAGLASTPGAAWAAARIALRDASHPFRAIPPGTEEAALKALPIWTLRIGAPVRRAMESVGLRTVGSVLTAPRAPLARRFGPEPLLRLDQALGRQEEPIEPRLAPGLISAERHLAEPVTETPAVEAIAKSLAETLNEDLERRGEGARLLELALFRVDGAVFRLPLKATRPVRDPRFVSRILRERLAGLEGTLEAGFGFDVLRLSVLATSPLAEGQADWLDKAGNGEEDFALFADRLRARLGDEALLQALPVASRVPERAAVLVPLAKLGGQAGLRAESDAPDLDRPLRLFAPPERIEVTAAVPDGPPLQFRWRRVLYRVSASEGPERIAPEWWRDEAGPIALELDDWREGSEWAATRDYFRVADAEGRRFWLFRLGLYDPGLEIDQEADQEASPRPTPLWFLHGAFA